MKRATVKRAKYARCGISSSRGTYNGMLKSVGRRTVIVGMVRIGFAC